MNLTRAELKKIMRSPITIAAFVIVMALNVVTFMATGNSYYAPAGEDSAEHIRQAKENGAYFKGAITDEWCDRYKAEADAMRNDPENMVDDSEKQVIIEELKKQGYTEEYILENLRTHFLKEEFLLSEEYNRYEPVEFSMSFYESAENLGKSFAEYYLSSYPGSKGEALATKAEADYGRLADDYTAYYNYDLGYQRMENMLLSYYYTLAVLMVVGLAGIFCGEYSRKTDALILSAKYGRHKIAFAKIKAGIIFSAAAWVVLTAVNLIMTTVYFGWEGSEAYWQDWLIKISPFCWNSGMALAAALATSLLGTIFFAALVMAISALFRAPAPAMLISFALLLIPSIDLGENAPAIVSAVNTCMPATIMRGGPIWYRYMSVYAFGRTVTGQYIVLSVIAAVTVLAAGAAVRWFTRHQVQN